MRNLIFDLDGTLTDPSIGITNSVMYALEKFGVLVEDRSVLYPFIGPPLVDSFIKYYGFSESDAKEALRLYREYFSVKGLFENEVYDGIPEMLKNLKKGGKKIFLATSKPELYALQILEHFGLAKFFDAVCGATMDESRNKKDEVIAYLIKQEKIETVDAVMVGDRLYDIHGGQKNQLKTVGVLYGFGSREELSKAKADYLALTVDELKKLLKNI